MVDRCLICGEIIPEGRNVCPSCENLYVNRIPNNQLNERVVLAIIRIKTAITKSKSGKITYENCVNQIERELEKLVCRYGFRARKEKI